MEEVEQLCDDIVIIDDGQNIAQGTKDDLLDLIDIDEKITLISDDFNQEFINDMTQLPHYYQHDKNTKSVEI